MKTQKLELLNLKLLLKKQIMTEIMIEEIQELHIAVHQEAISPDEIEEKYECRLTVQNIRDIRDRLSRLHMQAMCPQFGLPNFEI